MEIVYENGEIIDARVGVAVLQERLTHDERMAFLGCDFPNLTLCQNIFWLERDSRNEDGTPKTTLQLTVQGMVTEGLITQQRANEILA